MGKERSSRLAPGDRVFSAVGWVEPAAVVRGIPKEPAGSTQPTAE